jgi:hypothetical protein
MLWTMNHRAWRLGAACLFFLPGLTAQETRGSFQGTVSDSSGSVIPGATVTATNLATNVSIPSTTNREGRFDLLFLLPGIYRLEATATGFKTAQRDNVELRIHERVQLDFTLEIGQVSEKVQVTAEAPLLETASANLGQVFDGHRLANLPIPHGSPFSLIYFAPGTITARPTNRVFQETSNLDQFSNEVTFNGQPAGTSDWTIDGAPNVQSSKSIGPMNSPPADIVQEVKLETAFDASVGHTSGTVVNVSLKAGGNQPHGAAYGFFRNRNWDANSFFGNRASQARPPVNNKRWGASLSGPVYLPGIYNGKDKAFFTYGYEGVRRAENNTTTATVPTAKQLNGDFSDLLAIGPQYQIYDPQTIAPAANGRFSIQPFPGNIIPQGRISPIARAVSAYWTAPNLPGNADGTNNFTMQTRGEPDDYFNHTGRIDYNISERHRLNGRISAMRRIAGPYFYWYEGPSQGQRFIGRSKQAALDDVYTLSPRTVLNARYSYSRFTGTWSGSVDSFDPGTLGFSQSVVSLLSLRGPQFPCFAVSGVLSLGCSGRYQGVGTDIHAVFANVNHQHGSHGLKFGVDFRSNRGYDAPHGTARGRFNFGTEYTRGPLDNSPASPGSIGQGLAAFLLGIPSSGFVDNNANQATQSNYWALFAHDNWRVSRKLVIDAGLRWEFEGPLTERFDRSVRGFDPAASQPIAAAAAARYAERPDAALPVSQFRVQGGLLFAGINGQPRGLWGKSWGNFAPRFGLAYQAFRNMVVRSGFGIYPIALGQSVGATAIQSGFSQVTDLIPTLDNGQTFIATLANPFPNGILSAPGASQGAATFLGRAISFYDPTARTPYTMNWNFNVQTLLPSQFLLELGYTGNKALKLRTAQPLNATPNRYLSTSFTRDQATINYLTANVPNPFQGLLPGTALNGATISRAQLLSPYPAFAGITMQTYQGYSWFHSMQTRLERRLRSGLTLQASYMFSKKMEATSYLNGGDPVPYRTISAIDRPHTFTFTGLYALPIGRGRAIAGDLPGWANALAGGWELAAGWQYQSGVPIGFGDVIFRGDIKEIALPRSERTVERWINTDAGFDRVAANQRAQNLRQFPLRLSGVRTDVYNSADMSLLKNFAIYERHRFQFRFEAYNALNHATSFDAPNTNPTSTAFGTVTSQSSLPRQIQLGIKYVF